MIGENPEKLQLIAVVPYQVMSGLKPVSFGSDILWLGHSMSSDANLNMTHLRIW